MTMDNGQWKMDNGSVGIRVQYAEGAGELTEAWVKRTLKKVRRGGRCHLYMTLDPDGESSFFRLDGENGYFFLAIGEERTEENRVRWTFYTSCDPRYAGSEEIAPIHGGQDIILKSDTIQDPELAARCAEWYIRTGTPYPDMGWMKSDEFGEAAEK